MYGKKKFFNFIVITHVRFEKKTLIINCYYDCFVPFDSQEKYILLLIVRR